MAQDAVDVIGCVCTHQPKAGLLSDTRNLIVSGTCDEGPGGKSMDTANTRIDIEVDVLLPLPYGGKASLL